MRLTKPSTASVRWVKLLAQCRGCISCHTGRDGGLAHGLADIGDVGGDLLGHGGGRLHAAGNVAGRDALRLDRGCDFGGDLVDLRLMP